MPFTLYCLSSDLTGKGTLISPEKSIPIPFPNGHNFNFGAPILSVIIACITWGACATPLIISSAFTTIVVAAAAVVLPSSVMRASSRRSSVRMGMDGNEVGERCLHQILNRCTQVGSTVLFPEGEPIRLSTSEIVFAKGPCKQGDKPVLDRRREEEKRSQRSQCLFFHSHSN